jgi:hypothetical protein
MSSSMYFVFSVLNWKQVAQEKCLKIFLIILQQLTLFYIEHQAVKHQVSSISAISIDG